MLISFQSGSSRSTAAKEPASLKVPINFALGKSPSTTKTETELQARTVKAIAAAVAVVDPGKTLSIVQQIQESPADVFETIQDPNCFSQIKALIEVVTEASPEQIKEHSVDPPTANIIRFAANTIGADPGLTAVAIKAMQLNEGGYECTVFSQALTWVAAVDHRLLNAVPWVVLRERMLSYIQPQKGLNEIVSRLELIQKDVESIKSRSISGAD